MGEEVIEVPRVVDLPVGVPQAQYIDKVVDVPQVMHGQVPMVQTVQKIMEDPLVQVFGKIVDVPVTKEGQLLREYRRKQWLCSEFLVSIGASAQRVFLNTMKG